jgi:ATP-dependent DNA helicase RecG
MHPEDLISRHFRLTKDQQAALRRLGLFTIHNLIRHFPARHENTAESSRVSSLAHGSSVTLYGTLSKLQAKKLWKSRRPATEGWFEDGTGRVKVIWFNQPYIAKMTPQNVMVKVTGTVAGKDKPYITNPEVEPVSPTAVPETLFEEEKSPDHLFPVYPESRGITSRWFYHAILKVLESGVLRELEDPIPDSVLKQYHLPTLADALVFIHTPRTLKDAEAARKRFAFEEIFIIQVSKQKDRQQNDELSAPPITVDRAKVETFIKTFPFTPTGAQHRAIEEILSDFEQSHPMARLLEGDVGSGKTAVAAATAYAAVTSRPPGRESGNLQVAYMAPTEILATQHFQSFIEYFKELPINIALITGSGCYKFPSKINRDKPTPISRAQLLKWVANGEIAMVVGTHALIQKAVKFQNLAYAIVDEQHRFGTMQRKALAKKGNAAPHFLSMTATPIPRTLALTIYGDLDISVLDELPPERKGVETALVKPGERSEAYRVVRRELDAGRQAYVICPRIDEPDPEKEMALRVKSAKAEAERLKKEVFPDKEIALMHGKLKPGEKDAVMETFMKGNADILVSTSVIEVGVNVPNATCILIEGAERFGLAQLHQLRGRVLRSSHQAYCFLLPDTKSKISLDRLKTIAQTRNGFELAEADLQTRGAGDLYGRKQWGISDIGMEALKNPRLIEAARTEAQKLVASDPDLSKHPEIKTLAEAISERLHEE